MSLVALQTAYTNISVNLPNNTFSSVKKSFAFSAAAVTLLSGGNIIAGAIVGGVAATVSMVDSIATAAIRKMYPEKVNFEWYESYAKTMLSVMVVNVLIAPFLGSFIVNLVAAGIFVFVSDICKERVGCQVPIIDSQTLVLV
jgi:hypothetical protein